MKGDTLFNIGGGTVLVSLAGYAASSVVGLVIYLTNGTMRPDAMAICLVGFLVGLAIMGAGWALTEYQSQKGTLHNVRTHRRN